MTRSRTPLHLDKPLPTPLQAHNALLPKKGGVILLAVRLPLPLQVGGGSQGRGAMGTQKVGGVVALPPARLHVPLADGLPTQGTG